MVYVVALCLNEVKSLMSSIVESVVFLDAIEDWPDQNFFDGIL